jgi:hypothetical protein
MEAYFINIKDGLKNKFDLFKNDEFKNKFIKNLLLLAAIFVFFYILGFFIPQGFDWKAYFSRGLLYPIWTPWTLDVVHFVNWPILIGITGLAIVYRTRKYSSSVLPVLLAIFSLPTMWVIYMGNLDGLVLVGLILLPIGAPLALMKPQIAAFALLAKKNSIIAGIIWGVVSLLIWGWWPLNFLKVLTPAWKVEWIQDISIFPWGILLALPLMWFSRGDEDLLMAAGSLATPHLFPYHFILLTPALARMKRPWMIATWLITWTPLLANWLGPTAWHFGNLMSIFFWCGIYFSRKQATRLQNRKLAEAVAQI